MQIRRNKCNEKSTDLRAQETQIKPQLYFLAESLSMKSHVLEERVRDFL